MESRFRLNRLDVFALWAVIVTTTLFLGAALSAADLYTSVRPMSGSERLLGCVGWLIATFGPISIAIVFWRWSKHLSRAWIAHLLMLPVSYALVSTGARLMLLAIGTRDFDDSIGGPVLQGTVLFGLSVAGYYTALLFQNLRRGAKGRPQPFTGAASHHPRETQGPVI